MTPDRERWRIDELARRSGVSVDTIRFYLREELLPRAHREGRVTLFDRMHLDRLGRIRELQSRGFNLAAIRRLLGDTGRNVMATLFADEGTYDRRELVDATGAEPRLVDQLVAIGLLGDPPYDNGDRQVVDDVRDLVRQGLPEEVVLFLVRLYVEHFETMRKEMHDLLARQDKTFTEAAAGALDRIVPLTARVLEYVHRRSVQRTTIESIQLGDTATS